MLIIILVLLIILCVLLLVLYVALLRFVKSIGFNTLKEFIDEIKKGMRSDKDIYSSPKNLSDMTKLLEPLIQNDFPTFNKEQLFTLTKANTNEILDAIESKDIDKVKDKSLVFVRHKVEDEINKLTELGKNVSYTNVKFNKCAISTYSSPGGVAKVTVVTSLSYYYDSTDDKEKKYKDVRKETRYKLE